MKKKRYLFAVKLKDGSVRRFYKNTNDPFKTTKEFYDKNSSVVEEVTFREMR